MSLRLTVSARLGLGGSAPLLCWVAGGLGGPRERWLVAEAQPAVTWEAVSPLDGGPVHGMME